MTGLTYLLIVIRWCSPCSLFGAPRQLILDKISLYISIVSGYISLIVCQLRNINLGMKTSDVYIEWHGTRGMRWNALLPKLMELAKTNRPPDVLILYVGSNDVGYVKPTDLVRMIKTDMSTIKEMYPDTR
jgi:hypothetical protein